MIWASRCDIGGAESQGGFIHNETHNTSFTPLLSLHPYIPFPYVHIFLTSFPERLE